MAKQPYAPSSAELDGARHHVLYELEMLHAALEALGPCLALSLGQHLRNSILEAGLVHARNLHDFFMGDPCAKDDVLASHFVVPDDSGAPWKPPGLTYLSSCQTQINKALSHLTYHRVAVKPEWQTTLIMTEVDAAFRDFFAALSDSERSRWASQA